MLIGGPVKACQAMSVTQPTDRPTGREMAAGHIAVNAYAADEVTAYGRDCAMCGYGVYKHGDDIIESFWVTSLVT